MLIFGRDGMQEVFPYYRSMADRKRLQIVQYLAQHDEAPVTELGRELRLSQPLVSWHLSLLRKAGIVRTRKEGRQVLCSLNRDRLEAYHRRLASLLGINPYPIHPDAEPVRAVNT